LENFSVKFRKLQKKKDHEDEELSRLKAVDRSMEYACSDAEQKFHISEVLQWLIFPDFM
jgi:hypothetical protein